MTHLPAKLVQSSIDRMLTSGLGPTLLWVYFAYGLAFFGMGLAMALESGRYPAIAAGRILWPLALFGILHGVHEWLEFFMAQATALGAAVPTEAAWIRLGILAASFLALLLFGVQAHRTDRDPTRGPWPILSVLAAYGVVIAASAIASLPVDRAQPGALLDALIRYSLAFPGSLLAGVGLLRQASSFGKQHGQRVAASFRLAAAAFFLYAVTQLAVPRLAMFPANLLNAQTFRLWTGVPHQVIRTLLAIVITWALLRALKWMEQARRTDVMRAEQARVQAMRQQQTLRRELLLHTVRAQEEERARIARELHDETSQTLSAFALELAAMRGLSPRRKGITAKIEHLQDLSRTMSRGLFRMVHALRPAQLDDLGLVPALESLVEHDWRPMGMEVEVKVDGACRRLDSLVETVLFRVAQEAVSNVARHAGTRRASLRLLYGQNEVSLSVTDRGHGFDVEESFTAPRGWGLAGMRERIESMGGQFELRSSPGGGTVVEAQVPILGTPEATWTRFG